ncbi:peptide ABC transporter substrate-binding protein [Keratinibaculum paraultunense]|uniref:peptide ABC transporter substrate-binding protein n=1 Tax=Keratinibaculum paraultunense TaxID=1278232 RepID=UPI00192BB13A|nr:peptide ABC transporter substrate-binding protein [Keratinibaculum paraultunense]QQY79326.1 peptide ABC transporter substrate-binding protein [Keratinibaculum paraultunense]
MKRKLALLLALVLLLSVFTVACGKEEPAKGGDKEKVEEGPGEDVSDEDIDDEQYVTLTITEPQAIDPSKSSDIYSADILNEITEGLVRLEVGEDGGDVIAPAGAEDWDVSDDGLVWTFHLRDYEWEDGEPVTAHDFEYGMKRTINPETASVYAFLLYPIKNAEACNSGEKDLDELGVKAIDDKTLEITLEGPCAYFDKLLAFKTMYPQRKDLVEQWGDKVGSEAEYTISCGPFKLTEWTHKSELVLEKNENYWDADTVKLEKITYKVIEDPSTAYNMLSNGQIDICGVSKPEWLEKFKQRDDLVYVSEYQPSVAYQFFNQDVKLFSNANVRKAFILAIDREELLDVLYYGIGEPAYGWIPPVMKVGDKTYRDVVDEPLKKLKEENPDPKELLIKGLEELGMDPDPSKITVTMLQSGTDAESRRFAEYYQQAYETVLGINVEAEYMDWPVFLDRVQSANYELAGMGWNGDYDDPMTFMDMWITGSGMSDIQWSNKEYDELIKKAQTSLDDEERLECFKRAEEILLYEDGCISPIIYRKSSRFQYDYVKNIMRPLCASGIEFKYAYIQGRNK